jgi:hypothetical protein
VSILDGYLAEQLTDALINADIPQSAVVTVQETSGLAWEPVITDVPYACSGWVDTYNTIDHVDSNVEVNDRKVFIIASTLAVTPVPGNTVTIAGSTFSIITVALDPAGAAFVLQCRT